MVLLKAVSKSRSAGRITLPNPAATFVLVVAVISVSAAFGQNQQANEKREKDGFFGPKQSPPPNLDVIDGAKNPELIPEVNRWDELRRILMHVERSNQPGQKARPKMEPPYKDRVRSLFGSKLPQASALAFKYDQVVRDLNEERRTTMEGFETLDFEAKRPILQGFEQRINEAIGTKFRQDLMDLLDDREKAQVQEFVDKEAIKRIKFYKLAKKSM